MEILNWFPDKYFVRLKTDGTIVFVDVHGMNKEEMESFVNFIALLLRGKEFSLVIIHGYNNGKVLKEAIRKDEFVSRPHSVITDKYNLGITTYAFAA